MSHRLYSIVFVVVTALFTAGCPMLLQQQAAQYTDPDSANVGAIEEARQAVMAAPGELEPALDLARSVIAAIDEGTVERKNLDEPALKAEVLAALDAVDVDDPDGEIRLWTARGALLVVTDEVDEGMPHLKRAQDADPSVERLWVIAHVLHANDRAAEADDQCRTTLDAMDRDSDRFDVLHTCALAEESGHGLGAELSWASEEERLFFAEEYQARQAAQLERARASQPVFDEPSHEQQQQQPSSSPAPSPPSRVSVTIRNECRDSVSVFYGDDPRFGSGRHSRLGGNSRTSQTFSPGDMMWLVDDSRNGIGSVTVSANTGQITVNRQCTGISAR